MDRPSQPRQDEHGETGRLGREAEALTFENTRPLSADHRRALTGAASKGGRPRIGAGSQRINVTVERGLLKQVDAFAHKIGVSCAALAAEGFAEVGQCVGRRMVFRTAEDHSRRITRVANRLRTGLNPKTIVAPVTSSVPLYAPLFTSAAHRELAG